jgi:Uma2 family endonuclease
MVAELIDGVLYTSPRPASRHALASSRLGVALGSLQLGTPDPGSWWIIDEPELHFGEDVLVPDMAAWRCERMPVYPHAPFFTLPPDWVCEILSPSTENLDRTTKLEVYARERVSHVWLIDPIAKTLEVLSLDASEWRLLAVYGGHERIHAVPFDAITIELAYLWGETPPS